MSEKYKLDGQDLKKWGLNIVIFVIIPSVSAFFVALQGGVDMKVAYGVAAGTGYTSLVDLWKKFMAGK